MKLGKTMYALVDPTETYILWDYEDPFMDERKKDLLWRLSALKEIQGQDLLKDNVIRKVRVEIIK